MKIYDDDGQLKKRKLNRYNKDLPTLQGNFPTKIIIYKDSAGNKNFHDFNYTGQKDDTFKGLFRKYCNSFQPKPYNQTNSM